MSNCLSESVEKDFLGDPGAVLLTLALEAIRLDNLGRWWLESEAVKSSMDIEF